MKSKLTFLIGAILLFAVWFTYWLGNRSDDLEYWAALALDQEEGKRTAAHAVFVRALSSPDPKVRAYGARLLHTAPKDNDAVVQGLLGTLRDSDSDVRQASAFALGSIRPESPDVIRCLLLLLDDSNGEVSVSAANALARYSPLNEDVVKELIHIIELQGLQARFSAIRVLQAQGTDAAPALPVLLRIVDNQEPGWRMAERAICRIHDPMPPL